MERSGFECAIFLADVVGSMLLYQGIGDEAASRQITDRINGIINLIGVAGGEFVHSRGDDVLATFSDPLSALNMVIGILKPAFPVTQLRIGLHFGSVIKAREDIFGDAVNLTARFAAIANPGEAIISEEFVNRLPATALSKVRYLDDMQFKGKSQPQSVFTLAGPSQPLQTQIEHDHHPRGLGAHRQIRAVHITLAHGGKTTIVGEAESASLGRSRECDIVIDRQWVSRRHATILVTGGRVRLVERSSSGTFISMGQIEEVFTRREDILLLGSGKISPGLRLTSPDAQVIHFAIASETISKNALR